MASRKQTIPVFDVAAPATRKEVSAQSVVLSPSSATATFSSPHNEVLVAVNGVAEDSSDLSSAPEVSPSPKKTTRKRKAVKPKTAGTVDSVDLKPKRKRKAKAIQDNDIVPAGDEGPKSKRKRIIKPKIPIVYDIPEVVRKETTFKGK